VERLGRFSRINFNHLGQRWKGERDRLSWEPLRWWVTASTRPTHYKDSITRQMVIFPMVREKYRRDRIAQPKKGKVLAEHGKG
jgi:hypothetical protein